MDPMRVWTHFTPEHPRKIKEFENNLRQLDWSGKFEFSIEELFQEIDVLACYELEYYYRRRQVRSFVSFMTRFLGWLSGAIGLIMPLIAAIDPHWKELSGWGFVFVAVSGAFFGVNSLFGGTAGHISFTVAQLAIEKFIILKRIEWCKFKISVLGNFSVLENKIKALEFMTSYVEDYTNITSNETEEWKKLMISTLEKFSKDRKSGP